MDACPSAANATACAAIAYGLDGGDLTPFIAVQPVCATPSGICTRCSPAALSLGTCVPGQYTLQYSVADAEGRSAAWNLSLAVERLAASTINITIQPPVNASLTSAGASAWAASLSNGSAALSALLAAVLPLYAVEPASVRSAAVDGSSVVLQAGRYRVQLNLSIVVGDSRASTLPALPGVLGAEADAALFRRRMLGSQLLEGRTTSHGQCARGSAVTRGELGALLLRVDVQDGYLPKIEAAPPAAAACTEGDGGSLPQRRRLFTDSVPSERDPDAHAAAAAMLSRVLYEGYSLTARRLNTGGGAGAAAGCSGASSQPTSQPAAPVSSASTPQVSSAGSTSTSCQTASPSTTDLMLAAITDAVNSLRSATAVWAAGLTSSGVLVSGLDDTFSARDAVYEAAIKALARDADAAAGSAGSKADTVVTLLDMTAALQARALAQQNELGRSLATILNSAGDVSQRALSMAALVLEGAGYQGTLEVDAYTQ